LSLAGGHRLRQGGDLRLNAAAGRLHGIQFGLEVGPARPEQLLLQLDHLRHADILAPGQQIIRQPQLGITALLGQQARLAGARHQQLPVRDLQIRLGPRRVELHQRLTGAHHVALLDQNLRHQPTLKGLHRLAVTRHQHTANGRHTLIQRRQRGPGEKAAQTDHEHQHPPAQDAPVVRIENRRIIDDARRRSLGTHQLGWLGDQA